jgi:class I lanthipeptide synthase
VTDPGQIRRVVEPGLCHGSAGVLTAARRIAADALTPIPLPAVEQLHQQATPGINESRGLLDGTVGVDLANVSTTRTGWDACLLLA